MTVWIFMQKYGKFVVGLAAAGGLWLLGRGSGHKAGAKQGKQEVTVQHNQIIKKIEAKEAAKSAITQENVGNKLNDFFS
jgi:hypothetical protein